MANLIVDERDQQFILYETHMTVPVTKEDENS